RRCVRSDHQLLEHAEPLLAAQARAAELLDVEVARIHRVEVGQRPADSVDDLGALPLAVTPFGIEVAEAAHLEGEDGLERYGEGRAAMRGERDLGRARPAGAGAPAHAMVDRRHRLGSALVQAARGGDAAARVPAPALAVLVDGEVRAALVEMDR